MEILTSLSLAAVRTWKEWCHPYSPEKILLPSLKGQEVRNHCSRSNCSKDSLQVIEANMPYHLPTIHSSLHCSVLSSVSSYLNSRVHWARCAGNVCLVVPERNVWNHCIFSNKIHLKVIRCLNFISVKACLCVSFITRES